MLLGDGVAVGLLRMARSLPLGEPGSPVRWSFEDSDGTYGYRRVHAHLASSGGGVALAPVPKVVSRWWCR